MLVPGDRKKMTILTVVTKSIYGRHSADQWSRCDGSSAISKTAQVPISPSDFWRLIVVWLIKNDNLYKNPLVKQAIKMQKSALLDMASQYQLPFKAMLKGCRGA